QILFIGNSFTFVNKMPEVFAELADLGDHRVNVTTLAKSGYSLSDHAQDPETRTDIGRQKWDYIIFQEKSDIPIIDGGIDGQMYQGVQQINDLAAAQGAKKILFMPWAYQDGFPAAGMADYQALQSKVAKETENLLQEIAAEIVLEDSENWNP
ncbi:MAG: hypothetical protein MUO57_07265, partial [Anaerolineales bacterium]|nr:hypothetical protein [Anaerolineales bacterium]